MMFFSIIIPLYNKATSVNQTLQSILSQHHRNFEVIVVNDGSTDGSAEQVLTIKDHRLRLITQANQGVSVARNNGIREANSDYLVFFDADDIMGKQYLCHIKKLITNFPNAGAYGTRYQYAVGNSFKPSRIFGLKNKPLEITNYFYTASRGDLPIVASGVCIPKRVLSRVGHFPVGQIQGEDQDLWARIGLEYSMAVHPSCDITYVLDAENRISIERIPSNELPFSRNLQANIEKLQVPSNLIKDVKRYIAGHLIHLAELNIGSNRHAIAKQLLKDQRTHCKPLRRWKWLVKLSFLGIKKKIQKLGAKKLTSQAGPSKPRISNLLNDQNMGGILSVVKSLSESDISKKYEFNFELINPTSWARKKLNADIIMVHYASSWSSIIPNLLTRLLNPGAKMILQEHHYTASFESKVPSRLRFRVMLRLNYFIFDKVIAVSKGQGRWIDNAKLLPLKKSISIPQCRELSQFLQVSKLDQTSHVSIGAYGRLAPEKGFDKLIEAFNRVTSIDLTLTIAGTGPEEHRLKQLAYNNSAIHFAGRVDDVPSFLSECDLIVIPSTSEAFGLVCLEAKAAARPVIASDIDGLTEQISDENSDMKCGSLLSDNSADGILRLLRGIPNMPLAQWGINGRNQVKNAWADYQKNWDELFQTLAS
ncbi:MAG: glycosyltransferase [Kangiellaceae bacterium]